MGWDWGRWRFAATVVLAASLLLNGYLIASRGVRVRNSTLVSECLEWADATVAAAELGRPSESPALRANVQVSSSAWGYATGLLDAMSPALTADRVPDVGITVQAFNWAGTAAAAVDDFPNGHVADEAYIQTARRILQRLDAHPGDATLATVSETFAKLSQPSRALVQKWHRTATAFDKRGHGAAQTDTGPPAPNEPA